MTDKGAIDKRKQDEFDKARLLLADYIEKRDAHAFQDGSADGFKNGLKVGREEMRQIVFNALDNYEQEKIEGQRVRRLKQDFKKCSVLEYYNISYSDNTTDKEATQ